MPRLSHAREVCPKCGSLRVRKYGKLQLKEKVLQKYRCMDCKHVWYERTVEVLSHETFELILSMFRTFIRDMDQRKNINDAGWLPLKEEDIIHLQKTNFCEIDYENMRGRVNISSKLPEDLLLTEEGRIFSEYIKSLEIIRKVHEVCRHEKEYRNAIAQGLKYMFKKSRYTFWEKEEGSIPEKIRSLILSPQWIEVSESFADFLTRDLLIAIYGVDEFLLNTNTKNMTSREFSNILSIIFEDNILKAQWKKIIEYFREHVEHVEFLGLTWLIFKEICEHGIGYVGARVLVFEEIIKKVANKRGVNENDLCNRLKMMSEELDEQTEGESWGLNWSDIFTIPW
jgi:hypothetical protein